MSEVLEKHGLVKVNESEASIKEHLSGPALCSLQPAGPVYADAMVKLRQATGDYRKQAVTISTKVKKWTSVPDNVTEYLDQLGTKSSLLADLPIVFFADKKKGYLPDKMEAALAGLKGLDWPVPLAFRVQYFKEEINNLARFSKVNDILAMCSRISGYFSDVTDEELHGDLELVTVDAMSAALEAMISSTSPDPSGNLTDECKETMKNLGELTSRAAEVGVASLEGDLATLSALLGNAPGIEDQRAAVGKLEKQADDHDYSGILKLMFSSPQWPAILAWGRNAVKGEAADDIAKALSDAFNKIQSSVYLAADKELFESSMSRAFLALVAAGDQGGKTVRAALQRILPGVAGVARCFLVTLDEHVKEICAIGISSGKAPLELKVDMDRVSVAVSDVCNQGFFDFEALIENLGDQVQELVKNTESLAKPVKEISEVRIEAQARKTLFDCVAEALRAVLQARQAAAGANPSKDDTSTVGMVKMWSRINDALAQLSDGPHLFAESMKQFEDSCNLKGIAQASYLEKLHVLKESVTSMLQALAAQGPGDEEAEKLTKAAAHKVLQMRHEMMQMCSWSATPVFDRTCIAFISDTVALICESSGEVLKLSFAANGYHAREELASAFETVTDWDKCKPMIDFFVPCGLTELVMAKINKMRGILAPAQEEHFKKKAEEFEHLVQKLSTMLAEEPEPIGLTVFAEKLTQKSVVQIKETRAQAKSLQSSLSTQSISLLKDYKNLVRVIDVAKNQTFKWGLAKFAMHAQIRFETDVGKSLRSKLKGVWEMESLGEGVVAYLGSEACDLIKGILDIDKPNKDKKNKKKPIAAAQAAEGAPAKSRRKM